MQVLHDLVVERNSRETDPFLSVHDSISGLRSQLDSLESHKDSLELQVANLQLTATEDDGGRQSSNSAALRNETKLREQNEKLEEELKEKLSIIAESQRDSLERSKEISELKDKINVLDASLAGLQDDYDKSQKAMAHLTSELNDSKFRTDLAEQQYVGLKDTIRSLQEENDTLSKENRELETRFVGEKSKLSDEMNKLSEMVDKLKKERDMLRLVQSKEKKSTSWFGKAAISRMTADDKDSDESRKWGSLDVVVPSAIKQTISAHSREASCLRYDADGADLLATGSSDSSIKIWNTSSGVLQTTLRGGSSNAIIACDMRNGVVVGGGSDRTCRVWNVQTSRMVHHLVGHSNRITCVRIFPSSKFVITGSADRSLKVWDISRRTYMQTATLRHSSTSNCVDVGPDSDVAVTGHLDGGLRFWDTDSGERQAEIQGLHAGSVTCVRFHPSKSNVVVSNGTDSKINIVDIPKAAAILTLSDPDYHISYAWASFSMSPDGNYVVSGSNASGLVFVWSASTGKLLKKLEGHTSGVYAASWGKGGTSGQQVATIDKGGTLILWA